MNQNLQFTLGITRCPVHSKRFNKCVMPCMHHYSILQNSSTALKILSVPPVHPCFPSSPCQCLVFLHWCLHSSAFSRMPYSWNPAHSVQPFQVGFFDLQCASEVPRVFLWLDSSFLFIAGIDTF